MSMQRKTHLETHTPERDIVCSATGSCPDFKRGKYGERGGNYGGKGNITITVTTTITVMKHLKLTVPINPVLSKPEIMAHGMS